MPVLSRRVEGSEGDIWFAGVLAPPHESRSRHIVFTTPYVFHDHSEQAFIHYLERNHVRSNAQKVPLRTKNMRGYLMKYGPTANHWNEYIFMAYMGCQHETIFVTGISEVRESPPRYRSVHIPCGPVRCHAAENNEFGVLTANSDSGMAN
ncbi:MAG: hypothetical protein OXE85_14240 [Roseovarius sp.]|nr:hypothetical protein [Roseovarius sp.]